MKDKLGIVDVGVTRAITDSGYKDSKTLRFTLVFDKKAVVRCTRGNVGERAELYFGTGHNIGKVRIYLNRPNGRKLSKYSGDRHILQTSVTAGSENKDFYFAHAKDLLTENLQGVVYRAGVNTYIEVQLPAGCYKAVPFNDAVKALPEDPNLEGWHIFTSDTAQRMIAASTGKKAVTTARREEIAVTRQANLDRPQINYEKDYLVLHRPDGDLWVRRRSINIDVFRVVNGHPVVRASDGSEITLPLTPQELITAVQG